MDTTTINLTPILENQVKQYNLIYTDSLGFSFGFGCLIALILVLIFAKGYQSNGR